MGWVSGSGLIRVRAARNVCEGERRCKGRDMTTTRWIGVGIRVRVG